jgi:nucleoside phosphorylase
MKSELKTILITFVTEKEQNALFTVAGDYGLKPEPYVRPDFVYHDFGELGSTRIFGLQTNMGAGTRGGSLVSTITAIEEINPDYILAVGIAFGVNKEKQSIGDILISEQLATYEIEKITRDEKTKALVKIERGNRVPASERTLNRLKSALPYWQPSESAKDIRVQFGLVLSGEKLIDDAKFKKALLKRYPEAIGGEMEAAGLYAAAAFKYKDWAMVKAICDWAENKEENKEKNQEKAAINAARFVFFAVELGLFSSGSKDTSHENGSHNISRQHSSDQIKEKALKYIRECLDRRKAQYLLQALDHIRTQSDKTGDDIRDAAAFLLQPPDLFKSISILKAAVKQSSFYISESGTKPVEHKDKTWEEAVNILAYLLMMAVDYEQLDQLKPNWKNNLQLELPVNSPAGVEIVYSSRYERPARLSDQPDSMLISGTDRVNACFPETGFNTNDAVSEIMRCLYIKLYLKEPDFDLRTDVFDLDIAIKERREEGEHFYLFIDPKELNCSLDFEQVYTLLKTKLPSLDILSISRDDESTILVISESGLNTHLTEFFRFKPES